jgi:tripartite-type tricarboxylate transporter receptor subunit TctC
VAGIKTTEIPYNGPGPATLDLVAGRVNFWMTNIPNVQAGNQTRALAVAGPNRAPQLPDVPTFAEQGYGEFEASAWFALYAPAGTPKAIVAQINHDVNEVLAMPDVQQRFYEFSLVAPGGTPDDLRLHVQQEIDRWAKVIKDSQAASTDGKAENAR